jgi:hypothetical protein
MTAKQFFPKEHGTWAMLLVPWAIGCGVARQTDVKELLLFVAMLMFFLAQNQISNWRRLRFAISPDPLAFARVRNLFLIFSVGGIGAALPLITLYHLTALFYFGVIAAALLIVTMILVDRKLDRSLAGQVLASAGLSMSAPLAYFVARGELERTAFELWALNFLFFLGGVFYVQLKIDALVGKAELRSLVAKIKFAAPVLTLDATFLTLAFFTLQLGSISPWIILAFVPTTFQAIVGTLRLNHPAKLKRVGVISTVHSTLFALIVIALA